MNTELMIDAAITILAFLYLGVGVHWFKWTRREDRAHKAEMARIEKMSARARQVRRLAEERFWQ